MAETKKRLGRGLDALLSSTRMEHLEDDRPAADVAPPSAGGIGIRELSLDQVRTNPHQPRQHWNQEKLFELAESIKTHGLVQPIIVRAMGDGYELIAGERRLRAGQMAGLVTIPALVRDASEEQMLEWALVENIHRADLNALERARAYRRCMQQFGLTQQQLAERLGEDRATVANYIRLLELSAPVQTLVVDGKLTMGHARALLGLADERQRERLAEQCVVGHWSVRELERRVQALQQAPPPASATAPTGRSLHIMELEQELRQALGTKVLIKPSGRKGDRGKIVIDFYSLDDFDRIRERLR